MKRMKRTKKILSILICLSLLITYVPVGFAAETTLPLPQTPTDYAASDYAKYAAKIAVGDQHIAVVKPGGTVVVWGDDTHGQLGVPAGLAGVKVKTVAAGTYHTLALTEDGRVFTWGKAYDKDWKISSVTIPAEVGELQGNIRLIAAGSTMSAVVANDGRIVIWGNTADKFSNIPEGLESSNNIVALRISGNHAVALDDQGSVTVWGQSSTIPDALTGKTVLDVAVGTNHWMALTSEGQVVAGGSHATNVSNISNQENVRAIAGGWQFAGALLADGSVMGWGSRTPAGFSQDGIQLIAADENIKAFSSVIEVDEAKQTICAMRGDGTLVIRTGTADAPQTQIPEGLNLITTTSSSNNADLSSLSVAGYDLDKTFDAATTAYTVNVPNNVTGVDIMANTADANATLKINETAATSGVAQTVDNLIVGDNTVAVEVTAEDGTVKAYTITIRRAEKTEPPQGDVNVYLDSLTVDGYSLTPAFEATITDYAVNVPNAVTSVDITATAADTAALKINGTAVAGGSVQSVGNLKVGSNTVKVEVISGDETNTYNIIINRAGDGELPQLPEDYAASDYARYGARIAGGMNYAAAVLEEGTVELWGSNDNGQLEVTVGATGLKALAVGSNHTLALKDNDTIVAWGLNRHGQCDIPDQLNGKTVKAVAACNTISAALTGDNQIYVWGQNIEGIKMLESEKELVNIALNRNYLLALAAGGTVKAWDSSCNPLTPEQMSSDFSGDVLAISAGYQHVLALKKDGSVVSWDNENYPVPTELNNVRAIAAGRDYSAALCQDGTVTVWGKKGYNDRDGLLDVPSALGNVKALAAGDYNMYVLQADGTIISWGRNHHGEGDVPEDLNLFSEISINDRLVNLAVESDDGTSFLIYPVFSCEQTEGIVDVAYDTGEVRITAQPYSSRATLKINEEPVTAGDTVVVSGSDLSVGDNPFVIKVIAESGRERSYTLHVKRVSAGYTLPTFPQTPEAYQESEYAKFARRMGTGANYILAVKKDGTVVAWGQGSALNLPPGLDDVIAVSAGANHSLALREEGTVAAWGYNGDNLCVPDNLKDVVGVCAVGESSLALDKYGAVKAWGTNDNGLCELPDDLGTVVDIQSGTRHVLALRDNGTVAAWGFNYQGQCNVPADLDHVVAIAAGFRHSVALKDDGTMVTWGAEGTNYEIGNLDLQYVKGIAAGNNFVAALKWDGSLVVWGTNNKPVLGVPLAMDKKVLAIKGFSDYLLALNEDGSLNIWGTDKAAAHIPSGLNLFVDDVPYSGEAPDIPQTPAGYAASDYVQARAKIGYTEHGMVVLNMDGTVKYIPRSSNIYDMVKNVPEGLSRVTAIATSYRNVMVLQEDGTVVVWGLNEDRQCEVPENVRDITAITATGDFNDCCLALKNDGTVLAWGNNDYGQCEVPEDLTDVIAIATGYNHCLALRADGTVAAWGDNRDGQCDVPENLNNVARIFTGYNFSMALKNDGTVAAWGNNNIIGRSDYCGQCDVPEGLSGVVDICISGNTCIALKNNGTVVVWGDNTLGCRNVPSGLHDVVAISNTNGVAAIKADGMFVNWGYNPGHSDLLSGLSKVLTAFNDTVIFRDGSLRFCYDYPGTEEINAMLDGLNVLSGHYFAINKAELLNPAGQGINTVASQGGYRIKASVGNNNGCTTPGLAIIQVRGGNGAAGNGGGRVLGCVGISGDIPVTGSTVSSDFTMPLGISGTAYVDVFVWDGWDTMVPRAEASQNLSFTVTN